MLLMQHCDKLCANDYDRVLSGRNEHVEPEGFNDDAGAFGIRFVLVFVTCWFVEYVQLKIHTGFFCFCYILSRVSPIGTAVQIIDLLHSTA